MSDSMRNRRRHLRRKGPSGPDFVVLIQMETTYSHPSGVRCIGCLSDRTGIYLPSVSLGFYARFPDWGSCCRSFLGDDSSGPVTRPKSLAYAGLFRF